MNINSVLTKFAQIELVLCYDDKERDRINASLTQLEKIIANKFIGRVQEIIRFGSYTRNTILPRKYDPKTDVDLMVVFNTSAVKYSPGTYRRQLHEVLQTAYPNSLSAKDFPVVKLELNHIMFDVVPAYKDNSYWGNGSYYIPGANDSWRVTVPNDLNSLLSQKNQSYGNNIVRNVVRLCKHWNASQGRIFDSYEMEKWIVERYFYSGDNLYDKFLSIMTDLAYYKHSGVKQALDWIKEYKGTWSRAADEQKQFEWLQKLLPGL